MEPACGLHKVRASCFSMRRGLLGCSSASGPCPDCHSTCALTASVLAVEQREVLSTEKERTQEPRGRGLLGTSLQPHEVAQFLTFLNPLMSTKISLEIDRQSREVSALIVAGKMELEAVR